MGRTVVGRPVPGRPSDVVRGSTPISRSPAANHISSVGKAAKTQATVCAPRDGSRHLRGPPRSAQPKGAQSRGAQQGVRYSALSISVALTLIIRRTFNERRRRAGRWWADPSRGGRAMSPAARQRFRVVPQQTTSAASAKEPKRRRRFARPGTGRASSERASGALSKIAKKDGPGGGPSQHNRTYNYSRSSTSIKATPVVRFTPLT